LKTQTFEVAVIQEWYGEHNLGYCKHCGESLVHYAEVYSESCGCDECPEGELPNRNAERDDLPF